LKIKKLFLHRFKLGLAMTLMAALLAGCGEDATTATSKPSVAPTNASFPVAINPKIAALPPFVMRVWFADDYYNEPPIVDLMREFHQAYPNITLLVDHSEWSNMRRKLKDAVGAGNPPDIAHQHAFAFGAQGFAEPLDDLWQQWGQSALNRFMPGAMEDVTWGNVKYGVPLDINTVFLFYNKQMFKEVGLPEPGANFTYTQLLEDARKLTKPDGSRYGVAIKPGAWDVFGLLRSNGGDLIEDQSGKPTAKLDSPANTAMLEYLANLVNKEMVSPTPNFNTDKGPQPVDLFKQRKIAMFFSGPWDLKEIEKNGPPGIMDEVGTAPMPKGLEGNTNGSVQGGGSLFVPKGAKNREAAFEFMKWATSPKYQLRLTKEMGRYPVLTELYNDPYFASQPLLKPYLEQLKTARPYKLEAYAQADITWQQTIESILTGTNSTRAILADANRAIQAALSASLSS
jgi:ABC-type glycerol-3-phosphate transport system substrate-binding protein